MPTPSPRKRADGSTKWRVQFRLKPGAAPTSETFDTYQDALNYCDLIDRVGAQAARDMRDRATWDQAPTFEAVFADLKKSSTRRTGGTLYDYERTLKRCGAMKKFGATPVDLIQDIEIEEWATERTKYVSPQTGEPLSPKTIRNEFSIISAVFTHAIKRRWIATSPAQWVELPEVRKPPIRVLSDEEYSAILAHTRRDFRPLVQFLAVTGMRWGEATALRWGDFRVTPGAVYVTVQRAWKRDEKSSRKIGVSKTASGDRNISIPRSLYESLGEPGKASAYVFTTSTGAVLRHAYFHERIWRKAIYAAGVTPAPKIHDLRHYCASVLLAEGVPMYVVSKRLGHSSIKVTVDTYSFLTPDMAVAGMGTMERIIGLSQMNEPREIEVG